MKRKKEYAWLWEQKWVEQRLEQMLEMRLGERREAYPCHWGLDQNLERERKREWPSLWGLMW
jgi:hypothetical protein